MVCLFIILQSYLYVSKIFMLAWAKGRRLSYWAFTLTSYCIQVLPVCCRSKVLISVGRV